MKIGQSCSEALDLYEQAQDERAKAQILIDSALLVGMERPLVPTPEKLRAIKEGLEAYAKPWRESLGRKARDPATYNVEGFIEKLPPDRDGEGQTVVCPVRLDPEMSEFLSEQEHGRSYHIRQAVSGYIAEFDSLQKMADALGMLPGEAIAHCIRQAAKVPF